MSSIDLKQGKDVFLIGLTGNIACGKSTVLRILSELGAFTIDADTISHKIMQVGGSAYGPVVAEFGQDILVETSNGEEPSPIDRRKLGAIVFADPVRLKQLEAIIHPLVRIDMLKQIAVATQKVVVLDAIKLFENHIDEACDTVWVVACSPEVQLSRLMARNNFTREEALLRIDAQSPQAQKIARANVVIDNSASLEQTRQQVVTAWQSLKL